MLLMKEEKIQVESFFERSKINICKLNSPNTGRDRDFINQYKNTE